MLSWSDLSATAVISERVVDGVVLLAIRRNLKGAGETALRERIDALVAAGNTEILIDMGEMPNIDSSELGRLIRAHLAVRQAGGRVRLCNLSDRVVSLMKMMRLDTVLDIYKSAEEALALIRDHRRERS